MKIALPAFNVEYSLTMILNLNYVLNNVEMEKSLQYNATMEIMMIMMAARLIVKFNQDILVLEVHQILQILAYCMSPKVLNLLRRVRFCFKRK